jgi:hypothetical protein
VGSIVGWPLALLAMFSYFSCEVAKREVEHRKWKEKWKTEDKEQQHA